MARSNCLLFACALWLRRALKGDVGRITWRKSRYTLIPHFLYQSRKRRLIHFCPLDPRTKILPPPLFVGRVHWGDRP
jgi:hypothetical protein